MTKPRLGCAVGIALAVLLVRAAQAQPVSSPQPPPRDRLQAPRTGTAVVKGHVLDGTTGAAVARARVTVLAGLRSSILTDASGSFVFANLTAGPVMLSVEKPTYLSTRYPTPGRTIRSNNQPLVLADGQTVDNITISIFHGAAIAGRVLDANGDPLDSAQVTVLRVPSSGRIGRTSMRTGSSTDDRGEFRVGRLEPGTYIVQASVHRAQFPEDMAPGVAPSAPAQQPLPTYYPSALSIEQAQPITVARGQTAADVDIVLVEGFPGVVNGVVTTMSGAPLTELNGSVNFRRAATDASAPPDGYITGTGLRPDGTFRIVVPPGEYQIDVQVRPRSMSGPMKPEDEQFGTAKATVGSGTDDSVTIAVGRGAVATGRVVFEGTTPPPPSPGKAHIPLFSENGMCRAGEAVVGADWTFRIDGLFGTCSAPPYGFGRWVLKSLLINGENAADSPTTFQQGQLLRNVQVVVTDQPSSMAFRVSNESGQPTREYVAIVYPVEKSRWSTGTRTIVGPPISATAIMRPVQLTAVPGAGTVPRPKPETMSGLRPGEYYVVAVDDLEPEDSRDPVVLEKLRSSATRVSLTEGASLEVPLRRLTFADAMGKR